MILNVVCKEDFYIQIFKEKKHFSKGKIYEYKIDKLESLCDEQISHIVDSFPLSYKTFNENFLLLEDWRDNQIDNII